MPRALMSVSDKAGLVELATGLAAAVSTWFPPAGPPPWLRPASARRGGVRRHRRPRDDGRPGQDAAPDGARRHPCTPCARRRSGVSGSARHCADRPRRRQSLPVRGPRQPTPTTPFDRLIEEIDIGGPSLVRAAAKNFGDVLVVVSPDDYAAVLAQLDRAGGPTRSFGSSSPARPSRTPLSYDSAITATLADVTVDDGRFVRGGRGVGAHDALSSCWRRSEICDTARIRTIGRRGTRRTSVGIRRAQVLQGKELSYTNLLDLDAAVRMVLEFTEPAAVVIKHTNPCGVAIGPTRPMRTSEPGMPTRCRRSAASSR